MASPPHERTDPHLDLQERQQLAVDLPKGLAIAADVEVVIERDGDRIVLRPLRDAGGEKQKLLDMLADLKALGPVGEIEKRDPFEFPDRPGL